MMQYLPECISQKECSDRVFRKNKETGKKEARCKKPGGPAYGPIDVKTGKLILCPYLKDEKK